MTPPPMMTISRGMLGERGRLVARPDAGRRVVDVGELEDDRAGREDDGVALDDLRAALGQVDDELVGAHQLALAVDDVDLEPPGARLDLADELVDDALLARAQPGDVDRGDRRVQPELGRLGGVLDDVRRAQDGLGRDAAPVQARPAEPLSLDERHLRAEPSRLERRGVAARTAAEHCDSHGYVSLDPVSGTGVSEDSSMAPMRNRRLRRAAGMGTNNPTVV